MKLPAFLMSDRGTVLLVKEASELTCGSRLMLAIYREAKGQRSFFDAAMVSWELKDATWQPGTPWWKRWFTTPLSGAIFQLELVNPQPYTLDDWKRRFLAALDKDDDILCQNQEKEDIAKMVVKARRFSDFVWIWNWLQRDPDQRAEPGATDNPEGAT